MEEDDLDTLMKEPFFIIIINEGENAVTRRMARGNKVQRGGGEEGEEKGKKE